MKQNGFVDVYGQKIDEKINHQYIYYQRHGLDYVRISGEPKKHKGCL